MKYEYHGWIAIGTLKDDWDDGAWGDALGEIGELLALLPGERGHTGVLPESDLFLQTAYLVGVDADSIEIPLEVMRRIARICDASYGELAVLGSPEGFGAWASASTCGLIERYVLMNGETRKLA